MQEQLVGLIIQVIQDLAEVEEFELPDVLDGDTELFGDGGVLDSMGLVSMIVELEQAIETELGLTVSLADEKALSLKRSPYRTVQSLAEYAGSQAGS